MRHGLFLVLLGGFAAICQGAEEQVLPGTLSPDKKVAILRHTDGPDDYRYSFVQLPGKKELGGAVPVDLLTRISHATVVTSWNADSSKVALLVTYSAGFNQLYLAARGASGQFRLLELPTPDPAEIYRQRTHRTVIAPHTGSSDNAVGPWLGKNTVCLVVGKFRQTSGSAVRGPYVYLTFEAQVQGRRVEISDVQLEGPMTDDASEQFKQKWGLRYFNGDDKPVSDQGHP